MPMRNLEVELTKKLRQASDEAVQLGFNGSNYFARTLLSDILSRAIGDC